MNNSTNKSIVDKDVVVTLDYTLKVAGEIVDTSEGGDPIVFLQGHGQIIPGLESALYGMSIGDSKKVEVSPEEGYGEIDEKAFTLIPRDEFPSDIPLEPGVGLRLRDDDGEVMDAQIASVDAENVRLDFNHPLAGKDLQFSVTVLDLREATQEELEHGHVHDDADEEDWDDDDDLDEEEWEEDEEGEDGEEWEDDDSEDDFDDDDDDYA
jgi:FKBP-type peptidyl-prolyl cis-trans isomerase SlyD